MPPRRVRFTIRGLMTAVLVVAILLSVPRSALVSLFMAFYTATLAIMILVGAGVAPSGAGSSSEHLQACRFLDVRVLVAEDDANLGEILARGLREQGYVVDLVPDGETAAAYLKFYQYEVAVLDWRMPRLSGLDLVQRLRRGGTVNGSTPVLMLTARDTPADRIAGLDAGADDYLVKPFDFGELLARLRALQRRPSVSQLPRIVMGELEFDPAAREVLVRGQRPALTSTELGILEILLRRSPGVADRRSIAQHVWDNEADAFGSNTIDVHLARLRAKLAGGGVRIETVRGVGYRIIPA